MPATPVQPRTRTGEHAGERWPATRLPHAHGPQSPDEVMIGVALTAKWMLTTGRRLGQVPLLHDLAADQLIDFWADDHRGELAPTLPLARRAMCNDDADRRRRPTASRPAGSKISVPMFAVDIVSYSPRDPDIQERVRAALYSIMEEACDGSGVLWDSCYHEDRGDAIFVLAPADTSVEVLLDALVARLRSGLRKHNKVYSQAAQIRLRMALHAGYVDFDPHGVSGNAVNHLFRLLEAPAFKEEFNDHGGDLALIVSDYLYGEVVKYSPGPINPDSVRRIPVTVKETNGRGWLWLPSAPQPSLAAADLAACWVQLMMAISLASRPKGFSETSSRACPAGAHCRPTQPRHRPGRRA